MVTETSNPNFKLLKVQDILFMVAIGVALGLLGGLVQKAILGVIWAAILAGIWGAYSQAMANNIPLMRGIVVGGGLGIAVGFIGWLLAGNIHDAASGALFGLWRGILIGAAVGFVTRAHSEESDSQQTKWLIIGGSILLGLILGGLVGLTAGIIFGLIGEGLTGAIRATIAGAILGATVGSYLKEIRWVAVAAATLAVLAAASALIGGVVAGIIIGGISGSFAPILLVSGIGAFGGLSSRGPKAMVIEALEAPIEMMEQGAVPFLAPALIIGMIVGAVSTGATAMMALTITFSILGLFFAILGEINSGSNNKVTLRTMVETAMLGAETWPIRRVIERVTRDPRQAAIGTGIGMGAALAGGVAGTWVSHLLLNLAASLSRSSL
jgi:hypothetical protein